MLSRSRKPDVGSASDASEHSPALRSLRPCRATSCQVSLLTLAVFVLLLFSSTQYSFQAVRSHLVCFQYHEQWTWYGSGQRTGDPTVHIDNGTLRGRYSREYNQDFFLGVPYAESPTQSNRFRRPQSIRSKYGDRDAKEYSPACTGYGVSFSKPLKQQVGELIPFQSDQWLLPMSEDCLYLNIIRPSQLHEHKLPVALWIHGGGYLEGGGSDQRYNLSFMVQNSVSIGKPLIGISINYRLAGWGFLQSKELQASGDTNLGLRDQRMALHWVKENIVAFGGDPTKVTIFGESAGASSVGFHLLAYGGRDDKLFRGAIMQSGGPITYAPLKNDDLVQPWFDHLVSSTGCGNATNALDCLRSVPYDELNASLNDTTSSYSLPYVDGDFIQRYPSYQLSDGQFVHVPIINGATSDEGASIEIGCMNSTEDFRARLTDLPPAHVEAILRAYPDIPSRGIPGSPPLGPLPKNFRFGPPDCAQFRRFAAYLGDMAFIANRRLVCQIWARAGLPAYSYRFNAVPAGHVGRVTHFQDVAFVFYNLLGVGYAVTGAVPPFQGKRESYRELSRLMNSAWISFVHNLDPNNLHSVSDQSNIQHVEAWPAYSIGKPQNFVFDANVSSHAEPDKWRAKGIKLIADSNAAIYQR